MINNQETSSKFRTYHKRQDHDNMIAFEYVRFDCRKIVLADVFVPVKHKSELKIGDKIVSDIIKCGKTGYHILLTVKWVNDQSVHTDETGSPALYTCYKLLED